MIILNICPTTLSSDGGWSSTSESSLPVSRQKKSSLRGSVQSKTWCLCLTTSGHPGAWYRSKQVFSISTMSHTQNFASMKPKDSFSWEAKSKTIFSWWLSSNKSFFWKTNHFLSSSSLIRLISWLNSNTVLCLIVWVSRIETALF